MRPFLIRLRKTSLNNCICLLDFAISMSPFMLFTYTFVNRKSVSWTYEANQKAQLQIMKLTQMSRRRILLTPIAQ